MLVCAKHLLQAQACWYVPSTSCKHKHAGMCQAPPASTSMLVCALASNAAAGAAASIEARNRGHSVSCAGRTLDCPLQEGLGDALVQLTTTTTINNTTTPQTTPQPPRPSQPPHYHKQHHNHHKQHHKYHKKHHNHHKQHNHHHHHKHHRYPIN
ncbi:hypothetical protein FHG87_013520 [Trinorchestia longiramus]|nr:hypothetical protein FHG87_013520 [Trinorchestia longiramus]